MEPIEREEALRIWLAKSCHLEDIVLKPMAHDASFRRYFRIVTPNGSLVAMDAPVIHENCTSYVAIADALKKHGLCVPDILAKNLSLGFLLLSDLGDKTYLKVLNEHNADILYQRAQDALFNLQGLKKVTDWTLPLFNRDFMWQEWTGFKTWFIEELLGLTLTEKTERMLKKAFSLLIESAIEQPQVFMHRDYHSANLMQLENDRVGILDFQDAFIGPLTYDLVSLLRDCYVAWPIDRVRQWALLFHDQLRMGNKAYLFHEAQFMRWFDWMGIERHLKALMTFARKAVRDQQYHYLLHVPRTLHYLITVSASYPEMTPFYAYLSEILSKVEDKVNRLCVR